MIIFLGKQRMPAGTNEFLIVILNVPGLPQILGSGNSNTELTEAMREAGDVCIHTGDITNDAHLYRSMLHFSILPFVVLVD